MEMDVDVQTKFGCRDEDLHFKEIEVQKKVGFGLTRMQRMHASCRTNSTHRASHTPTTAYAHQTHPPTPSQKPITQSSPHPERTITFDTINLLDNAMRYHTSVRTLQSDHSMFAAPCRSPPQLHHIWQSCSWPSAASPSPHLVQWLHLAS